MSFHDEIMNIQVKIEKKNDAVDFATKQSSSRYDSLVLAYNLGHRDARHDAAELSIEADRLIEEYEREQCGCCDHVKLNDRKGKNAVSSDP